MVPGNKVDEFDRARGCLEPGYEDQRTIEITTLYAGSWISRRDQPAAMLGLPEKR
jgi:hypothetical protein